MSFMWHSYLEFIASWMMLFLKSAIYIVISLGFVLCCFALVISPRVSSYFCEGGFLKTGFRVWGLGAYRCDTDKKLSISLILSESLLHYFVYSESINFAFRISNYGRDRTLFCPYDICVEHVCSLRVSSEA